MLPRAVGAQVHTVQRSSGRFEQPRVVGPGVGRPGRRLDVNCAIITLPEFASGEISVRTANGAGECAERIASRSLVYHRCHDRRCRSSGRVPVQRADTDRSMVRKPGVLPRNSCRMTERELPTVPTTHRLGVMLRRADVHQAASLSGSPAANRSAGTAASGEPPRHIPATPDSRRAGDSASATLRLTQ